MTSATVIPARPGYLAGAAFSDRRETLLNPDDSARYLFLLYIGPDVLLPIASALAAIAGVLLMFWHKTVGFFKKMFGAIGRLFGKR